MRTACVLTHLLHHAYSFPDWQTVASRPTHDVGKHADKNTSRGTDTAHTPRPLRRRSAKHRIAWRGPTPRWHRTPHDADATLPDLERSILLRQEVDGPLHAQHVDGRGNVLFLIEFHPPLVFARRPRIC